MKLVKTTFSRNDVEILLKDLTGVMQPLSAAEREVKIQSGIHYSRMLPKESLPSEEYFKLYEKAMKLHTADIVNYTQITAKQILEATNWRPPVLISLPRAGIPFGILLKRYLKFKYNFDCKHFAVSIIRGEGIDENAMNYVYESIHSKGVADIIFVDGWTGKGAIMRQLESAVKMLKNKDEYRWAGLMPRLAVMSDPTNIATFCGTNQDVLLPTACMNSITSGLISRTILNEHIDLAAGDFHGAVYFGEFEKQDLSNSFIDTISAAFSKTCEISQGSLAVVKNIMHKYNISDITKVKPGIGETTRVLLRRVPWMVLVNKTISPNDPDIAHILVLCKEKSVPVSFENLGNYKVCGLIKDLADV